MKTAGEIIKGKVLDLIYVDPDSTVYDAIKVMNEKKIGAILIKKGEDIVGIWTERDLLRNSLKEDFDPKKEKIANVMTTGLLSADVSETVYQLWDKFLGMRLRHLLITKEGKYIGLISSGDVIKASLNEKNQELKDLNAMMSWEYYENWRWSPKKNKDK